MNITDDMPDDYTDEQFAAVVGALEAVRLPLNREERAGLRETLLSLLPEYVVYLHVLKRPPGERVEHLRRIAQRATGLARELTALAVEDRELWSLATLGVSLRDVPAGLPSRESTIILAETLQGLANGAERAALMLRDKTSSRVPESTITMTYLMLSMMNIWEHWTQLEPDAWIDGPSKAYRGKFWAFLKASVAPWAGLCGSAMTDGALFSRAEREARARRATNMASAPKTHRGC